MVHIPPLARQIDCCGAASLRATLWKLFFATVLGIDGRATSFFPQPTTYYLSCPRGCQGTTFPRAAPDAPFPPGTRLKPLALWSLFLCYILKTGQSQRVMFTLQLLFLAFFFFVPFN